MAFEQHEWALSGMTVSTVPPQVEAGLQYLKVLDASYDENNARYRIKFQSLANDAEFSLMFFFADSHDDSIPPKLTNRRQMGTVASLGEALAGCNIGIPNPADIIGGVVMAEVSFRDSTSTGKTYTTIYKFEPVPKEVAGSFADIDQYSIDESAPAENVSEEEQE